MRKEILKLYGTSLQSTAMTFVPVQTLLRSFMSCSRLSFAVVSGPGYRSRPARRSLEWRRLLSITTPSLVKGRSQRMQISAPSGTWILSLMSRRLGPSWDVASRCRSTSRAMASQQRPYTHSRRKLEHSRSHGLKERTTIFPLNLLGLQFWTQQTSFTTRIAV